MPDSLARLGANRYVRFLLSGGFNTAATYFLYLLLASVINYQIAYLIAYCAGIALAYVLNVRLVFNARSTVGKIVRYPAIYVVQYFLGAGLLYLMVSVLHLSRTVAPLIVIVVLLPVSYYMNKKLLSP